MKVIKIARIFGWMLWRDITLVKNDFLNKTFDAILWSTNSILISNFLLTAFGTSSTFGIYIWVGTIVTMSFFESAEYAHELVADITGDGHIKFLLTLPIPAWLVFVRIALAIAINCIALGIFIVPLGKLLLMHKLDLSQFSYIKFALIFLFSNVMFGFFGVLIASWAKGIGRFSIVRRRIFNPLWVWGGYQFSWAILAKTFPQVAMLALLNPITYTFEGTRSAILGPENFINFWYSLGAILIFIGIFSVWGIK